MLYELLAHHWLPILAIWLLAGCVSAFVAILWPDKKDATTILYTQDDWTSAINMDLLIRPMSFAPKSKSDQMQEEGYDILRARFEAIHLADHDSWGVVQEVDDDFEFLDERTRLAHHTGPLHPDDPSGDFDHSWLDTLDEPSTPTQSVDLSDPNWKGQLETILEEKP